MILTKSGNYIRFKEVMKMTKIKLTQEAYIEGYEGAFLRYGNSVHGIWDNWYTAHAEDGEGNSYNVYWKIKGDYDPEIMGKRSMHAIGIHHTWLLMNTEIQ